MDTELLRLTYEACDAFKARKDYRRLLELKQVMEDIADVQKLIQDFSKAKERYLQAKTYGKYHPDLAKYQKAFQQAKMDMMANAYVKEYKQLEKTMQKALDQFSIDLAQVVSFHIKHPREMNILNLEER
jgi:cell fate (sporulation/competence/biofilm development) regulator YlbF (YheA/YmcA/DUF963 family)